MARYGTLIACSALNARWLGSSVSTAPSSLLVSEYCWGLLAWEIWRACYNLGAHALSSLIVNGLLGRAYYMLCLDCLFACEICHESSAFLARGRVLRGVARLGDMARLLNALRARSSFLDCGMVFLGMLVARSAPP